MFLFKYTRDSGNIKSHKTPVQSDWKCVFHLTQQEAVNVAEVSPGTCLDLGKSRGALLHCTKTKSQQTNHNTKEKRSCGHIDLLIFIFFIFWFSFTNVFWLVCLKVQGHCIRIFFLKALWGESRRLVQWFTCRLTTLDSSGMIDGILATSGCSRKASRSSAVKAAGNNRLKM